MSRREIWIHQNLITHMWMDVVVNLFNKCCDCNFGLKFWCQVISHCLILPRPPTQVTLFQIHPVFMYLSIITFGLFLCAVMSIFLYSSLAMAWALFIFGISMLSSVLQLHILVLAFVDIVDPITLSFCMTLGLCIIAWYWFQMPSHHVKLRSDMRSQGTQTLDEPPTIPMVWASRGGKCFHLSDRCAFNGANQDITALRRCRNCG